MKALYLRKITVAVICILTLNANSTAMVKKITDPENLSEVFTNEKLNTEFYKNNLAIIEAVIKKDSRTVEDLLKKTTPKVATVLANQVYQNIQHRCVETSGQTSVHTPLRTIAPFFKGLTDNQRHDLDVVTPLLLSVFLDGVPTLTVLLHYRAKINAGHGLQGFAPLHIATLHNPKLIPLLIQHGADVEVAAGISNTTPLMVACRKDGKIEAIEPLLAAGASYKAKSYHGPFLSLPANSFALTPLHIACNNGQLEKAKLLLARGVPVDESDLQGQTPLHWSAMNIQGDCITLLLAHGADCTKIPQNGKTVIDQIPCDWAYEEALELFRHGAPYPRVNQKLIIEGLKHVLSGKSIFLTNLINAIVYHDSQALKKLLPCATGNELNEADNNGMTPFMWAVVRDNKEAALALHALGKEKNIFSSLKPVDMDQRDNAGRTAQDWIKRIHRRKQAAS